MEFAINKFLKPNKIEVKNNEIDNNSIYSLMFSNIFLIVLAIFNSLNIAEIFWIYWSQSVIIGILNFFRIYYQENISTDGLSSNGKPVLPNKQSARSIAFFFAFHFGFFHFGYFLFILDISSVAQFSIINIILAGLIFIMNHIYSFSKNYPRERFIKTNIGTLLFFPYLRIIPMHFAIIFGSMFFNHVLVLIVLKSIIDIFSHKLEHQFYSYKNISKI